MILNSGSGWGFSIVEYFEISFTKGIRSLKRETWGTHRFLPVCSPLGIDLVMRSSQYPSKSEFSLNRTLVLQGIHRQQVPLTSAI